MRRVRVFLLVLAGSVLGTGFSANAEALAQRAYLWQRSWTGPVRRSLAEHAPRFQQVVVLAAEIGWRGGHPSIVRVALDPAALRATGRPIGLALRIGPFSGPFDAGTPAFRFIEQAARSLLAGARSNGIPVAELQLDFDCAESGLAGYRGWIEALKPAVAPVPLTITTLPSWLRSDGFAPLVRATDGFVLQVHSLARPKNAASPFTLCDPVAARAAVERAGRIGVPFFVALPTYGYGLVFDGAGKFSRVFAEGDPPVLPSDSTVRAVRADPVAMSRLVSEWSRERPAPMRGVVWYRLPVAGDALSWRWPTLETVMRGEPPKADVNAAARRPKPGLIEIDLANAGTADAEAMPAVAVSWPGEARLVAADALPPFRLERGAGRIVLRSPALRLPAGERRMAGWLRFSQPTEVTLETIAPR